MHTRHSRAAVDTTEGRQQADARQSRRLAHTITLWAERPLTIRQGRLIAVRLRGDHLQVRLVDPHSGLGTWRSADGLISEFQAEHWVATSRFGR